jgi:hypothetical protein
MKLDKLFIALGMISFVFAISVNAEDVGNDNYRPPNKYYFGLGGSQELLSLNKHLYLFPKIYAGAIINPNLTAGVHFRLGPLMTGNELNRIGYQYEITADTHYYFSNKDSYFNPYIGTGAGLYWRRISTFHSYLSGVFKLSGGTEINLNDNVGVNLGSDFTMFRTAKYEGSFLGFGIFPYIGLHFRF